MAYKADYEQWLKEQNKKRLQGLPPPVMPHVENKIAAPAPTRVRDKKKK